MQTKTAFDGYQELIAGPLEKADPASFNRIKHILAETHAPASDPIRHIIQKLTGRNLRNAEARRTWKNILRHKADLSTKLGRTASILTSAIDWFEIQGHPVYANTTSTIPPDAQDGGLIDSGASADFYLEKLKEEISRARRYKHALSVIMLDIGDMSQSNNADSSGRSARILSAIVKIIGKTVRTVDIVAQYSDNRFVVILPNTNRRESEELAERLCNNISSRIRRIPDLSAELDVSASVEQCSSDSSAMEFFKMLENALVRTVHSKSTRTS